MIEFEVYRLENLSQVSEYTQYHLSYVKEMIEIGPFYAFYDDFTTFIKVDLATRHQTKVRNKDMRDGIIKG